MNAVPVVSAIPLGVVTLADHEAHARTLLDDNAWAYLSGGAADEITLRANQHGMEPAATAASRAARHWPAVIPVSSCWARPGNTRYCWPRWPSSAWHTQTVKLPLPMLLLPRGWHGAQHASQRVAGIGRPSHSPRSAPRPLWFQLYLQHDRGFTRELVQRAERAGFEALVLTVDAPTSGTRDRERRAGFRLPPDVCAVNLAGLTPPPRTALQPGQSALFDGLLAHAPTWDDVIWLQSITRLPIAAQGRAAPRRRAAGSIAFRWAASSSSNHGGRTLDTSPATAAVLPRIVQALAGDLPVLVDGGIRRGTDVLKAMALGASAVLVGRPYVYGLVNAGALGVAHVLRLLRDELEIAMALCGCPTLAQATPDLLFKPD